MAGWSLAPLLLVLQLALALYFTRWILLYAHGNREMMRAGTWPQALPLPRRLQTRLDFLTSRYAKHAPRWEVVIWLRLLALELVNIGLTLTLREVPFHQQIAVQTAFIALAAAIVLVAWLAHNRVRPYALRRQNQLASVLFAAELLLLCFGLAYQLFTTTVSAPEWVENTLEVLLGLLLVGSLACSMYAAVAELRRTQLAVATMDLSALSLRTVDKVHIDQRLADRLRDSTVRLLRTDWLAARHESDAHLGRESTEDLPVMSRRQDLPEAAFVPPEQAAELLERADRSVLVLSYGWCAPQLEEALGGCVGRPRWLAGAAVARCMPKREGIELGHDHCPRRCTGSRRSTPTPLACACARCVTSSRCPTATPQAAACSGM
jgi:hypothetical protein